MIDINEQRKGIITSLCVQITRKTITDETDPLFILVKSKMKDMPLSEMMKFYEYYATSKRYYNKEGFSSTVLFQDALADYKETISMRLWEDHKVNEKIDALVEKIGGLYHSLLSHLYQEDLRQKATSIKLDRLYANKKQLFSKEDIDIITKAGGLYHVVSIYVNQGVSALKERFISIFKNMITSQYFSSLMQKGEVPAIAHANTPSSEGTTLPATTQKAESLFQMLAKKSTM